MKKHYGEKVLIDCNEPDWTVLATRPERVQTPKQGPNQCGHYMVKFALYWNGKTLTKDDEHFHVSPLLLPTFNKSSSFRDPLMYKFHNRKQRQKMNGSLSSFTR